MRLLFLTENHPPDRGGMAESCDRIVRGLSRSGVAIDIVHFDRRCVAPSHRVTGNGSLTRVPLDADMPHALNLLWNRLQQTLDLTAITHVVAFGGTLPLLAAPVFAAWIERPLVTLLRGNELDLGIFDPRRRPFLDDALRRSAAVVTVTTSHARKVAALHAEVKPHVIANGIDLELWQATDADHERAASWRKQHVSESRRVLGLFGHLKSKKGVPFFIESLRRSGLADRFHLLLIGEVDEQLQIMLADLSSDVLPAMDRFALLPFYLACDLIVIPSHYDGFPNVLIEAMALARPLLASTVGGVEDVVTAGEGFLFAPGDDQTCRLAIARAASAGDEELQQMGANAAAVVRRRCNASDETRRYLEVLTAAQEVFDAQSQSRFDRSADPAPRRLWG
jgi:glycosyltransferase involved in cell wall biosynthesis